MKLTVINDTHLGVTRQTGTTPESQKALTRHMQQQFKELLSTTGNSDLLINGDIFDKSEVDKQTEFFVFGQLQNWCKLNPHCTLFLAAGNHDESKSSDVISSFHNLVAYLQAAVSNVCVISRESKEIYPNIFVIPHMMNQELFSEELENVLAQRPKFVFLHANYDNKFAAQTDHSLNVSAEVAEKFAAIGCELIFAHEHKKREIGNVHIIGNQIISSVADCLGDDTKQYLILDDSGLHYQIYKQISECFTEVDWLSTDVPNKAFLRVTGGADYEESAAVISALRKLRQQSDAYVVTNAVRLGSITGGVVENVEDIKNYDIKNLIKDKLPENLKSRFAEVVSSVEDLHD